MIFSEENPIGWEVFDLQIIVKLTTACNLRCIYCSEGDKPQELLSQENLFKLIRDIPEVLEKYHDDKIEFLWHGGEPLTVGRTYLSEVMDYALDQLGEKYKIRFLVQTNGTLIDDAWIELFKKYHMSIGISLDGYQELHDHNRKDKEGKPTFEKIMKNVEKLQQNGFRPGSLMVLDTSKPVDAKKLYAMIKKYHMAVKIHPVIACGRAEGMDGEMDVYRNYVELMKELYRIWIEDGDSNVHIDPIGDIIRAMLDDNHLTECSYNGSCARNFVCMYANGDIGFCGRSQSEKYNLTYGNIQKHSLLQLYESVNARKIRSRQTELEKTCGHCEYWRLCHGGCAFEAVNATGNLYRKFPKCEERKELLHFLETEGIELLRRKLVEEKIKRRAAIREKKKFLKELENERK